MKEKKSWFETLILLGAFAFGMWVVYLGFRYIISVWTGY